MSQVTFHRFLKTAVTLAFVLVVACGGSGKSENAQADLNNHEPTVIQGTWSFELEDVNQFLLDVFYTGVYQSFFAWPNIEEMFECPGGGLMLSSGVLSIDDQNWTGSVTYTFDHCAVDLDTVMDGDFLMEFTGQTYQGSGRLKFNSSDCTITLAGDWDSDQWNFCNHIHLDADLK